MSHHQERLHGRLDLPTKFRQSADIVSQRLPHHFTYREGVARFIQNDALVRVRRGQVLEERARRIEKERVVALKRR